jgi:hypothetical protein
MQRKIDDYRKAGKIRTTCSMPRSLTISASPTSSLHIRRRCMTASGPPAGFGCRNQDPLKPGLQLRPGNGSARFIS